jgi:osmotically-inducible protein OsmY
MRIYNELMEDIESALMEDPRTRDAIIEVDNHQGIVSLSGLVESPEIAEAAEEIASQQTGVIKVVNSLKVRASAG